MWDRFPLTLRLDLGKGLFGLDKKIAFNVWDFAGQLEYLTTHQFFISPTRTVIILLFDLSAPIIEQRTQLRHWYVMPIASL